MAKLVLQLLNINDIRTMRKMGRINSFANSQSSTWSRQCTKSQCVHESLERAGKWQFYSISGMKESTLAHWATASYSLITIRNERKSTAAESHLICTCGGFANSLAIGIATRSSYNIMQTSPWMVARSNGLLNIFSAHPASYHHQSVARML